MNMNQAAFPTQEKRQDVLILCTSEIFIYIEENLKLTPQSMSDKMTAQDELEEMHRQVIHIGCVCVCVYKYAPSL